MFKIVYNILSDAQPIFLVYPIVFLDIYTPKELAI